MAILTLKAIEAYAWNAVEYDFPEDADSALLFAALRAVQSCVAQEHEMMLAMEASSDSREWSSALYKTCLARWRRACERLDLIAERYAQELRLYNQAHQVDRDRGR